MFVKKRTDKIKKTPKPLMMPLVSGGLDENYCKVKDASDPVKESLQLLVNELLKEIGIDCEYDSSLPNIITFIRERLIYEHFMVKYNGFTDERELLIILDDIMVSLHEISTTTEMFLHRTSVNIIELFHLLYEFVKDHEFVHMNNDLRIFMDAMIQLDPNLRL